MTQLTVFRVPGVSDRPNLERLARDPILRGANGGGLFAFDLSFGWSYDGTTPPADAKLIRDLAEAGDGALSIRAGQSIANAGGGLDFTGLTNDGVVIKGPAGCLSSLQAQQQFALLTWIKLPAIGDWNSGSVIAPFFTASGPNSYTAGPDLLTLAQRATPTLSARRQTNGGSTVAELEIGSLTNFYGRVCQVLYSRTALATTLQVRSSVDQIRITGPAGALNSGDLSALAPQWGVTEAFNNLVDGSSYLQHRAAAKYRIYRAMIENLHVSGRDPVALADDDWEFATGTVRYS